MTTAEKRNETYRRNREARERKEAEQAAERELIRKGLQEILASEDATAAEKLEAGRLLLDLNARR